MRSIRRISLIILLSVGSVAQSLGQSPKAKRELDVPYVPTQEDVVAAMLKTGGVKKGDILYDLGCGDGRIVIAAAKRFGARGVGIDIDPQRIREANANARQAGVTSHVTFILGDIFADDVKIGEATVVALYLLPSLNERLRPKLWRDLKPGTRIVSNNFDMSAAWPPDRTQQVGDNVIYFWTMPKR